MPQEIHHKMLPTSRTIAMRQTSKTMRTAVEQADAVVQARRGVQFASTPGLKYHVCTRYTLTHGIHVCDASFMHVYSFILGTFHMKRTPLV